MQNAKISGALELFKLKRPLVVAHRGYSDIAPENTLPAFDLALTAVVDLVELDYRETLDGHLVAIHDAELDRTTDVRKRWRRRHNRVGDRTFAEISSLDAGSWFAHRFLGTRVPSLAEAAAVILKGSVPLLERKSGSVFETVRFLRGHHLVNKVIIQSFDWEFLRQVHEQVPEQVLGALGPAAILPNGKRPLRVSRGLNRLWLKQVDKTGAKVVVWSRRVSTSSIRAAHERGLKVLVYTVNELRIARHLLNQGVDGLITNKPPMVHRLRVPGKTPGTIRPWWRGRGVLKKRGTAR
jgi:glycerophosphoryl diester phosphodiesterase